MANAYVINSDGVTSPMERVRCKNEDKELQLILEKNPDLLPGDQINPENPRRWLQIEREMPVPDPSTGSNRWSIDFLFADQSAMPTFIECKRFSDTRSRREVVGQMFEYAANGHYYWDKAMMRELAEKSAKKNNLTLEDAIFQLQPDNDLSVDAYFEQLEENLKSGQIRLVFFLEEAPMELKSVVDFLNKQMERSEVLLVEARQYRHENTTFVMPMLFGYTEEARRVKRTITVTDSSKKTWDYTTFFAHANETIGSNNTVALKKLSDTFKDLNCVIYYGTGKSHGNINIKIPSIANKTIFSIGSDGKFWVNFEYLTDTESAIAFQNEIKTLLRDDLKIAIPNDYNKKFASYKVSEWVSYIDTFTERLRTIILKYDTQK